MIHFLQCSECRSLGFLSLSVRTVPSIQPSTAIDTDTTANFRQRSLRLGDESTFKHRLLGLDSA